MLIQQWYNDGNFGGLQQLGGIFWYKENTFNDTISDATNGLDMHDLTIL